MKTKIINLNKKTALNLLSKNKNNRRKSKQTVKFYVDQMQKGLWKENGEPIIIDKNGQLKDGQHRCEAVIEANHAYMVPLIYDVDPEVMHTIDTGKNRNLADILSLNGFKNSTSIASFALTALRLNNGFYTKDHSMKNSSVSNGEGLDYALLNKDYLNESLETFRSIYSKQLIRVFTVSDMFRIQHMIMPYIANNEVMVEFIKNITGVLTQDGTGCNYIYRLMVRAKKSKTPINHTYLMALVVKAWNLFTQGNPPVKYLKHDLKYAFPTPNKID